MFRNTVYLGVKFMNMTHNQHTYTHCTGDVYIHEIHNWTANINCQ